MKKGKVKIEYTLLLDLRSSSIGYGLIDNSFKIISSKRKHFYLRDVDKIQDYMKLFFQTIDDILESFRKEHYQKFDKLKKIEISLSSPWYKINLKNFDLNKGKKKKITKKYFESLINSDSVNNINNDSEIIEKRVLDVVVNGYSLNNPIGKEYNELSFSVYVSSVEKKIKNSIQEHIKKILKKKINNFHTHPLINYSNLINFEKEIEDFIIMDISGEITDIYISKNNNLIKTISIPIGTHFLIRRLVKDLQFDNNTAFSRLELLNNNHLAKLNIKEELILNDFEEEWLSRIKDALIDNKIEDTPNAIFVFSDKNINQLLIDILKKPDSYSKYLMTNIKPNILSVDDFKQEYLADKRDLNHDNLIVLLTEYLKITEK